MNLIDRWPSLPILSGLTHVLTARRLGSAVRRRVWSRTEQRIYRLSAAAIAALPHPRICNRDRWEDLQFCTAWSYGHLSRDQYLASAECRRQSGGQHLYSLVENGVLIHYGWLQVRQTRSPDLATGMVFVPPAESSALWDFFTHPVARGRGLYGSTLLQCLHDAVELDGARQVYIYTTADNSASRHVIEKIGFEHVGSLCRDRRLLRSRRYAVAHHGSLDVRLLPDESPARVLRDTTKCCGSPE